MTGPCNMDRDLSLATVLGALCILGAYAVVCWGLDAVRWVLG